ncbi:MAG: tRNA-dihydrouridine synthase [Candidatus Yonathbacteria bacterium]|nr:tRNA-dihydrouridine synthase [Candidatus Yonathbacteria bacterium]
MKSGNENNQKKFNLGFWANLPKPFFALAPMADVTDSAFRQMIAKHSRHGEAGGGPDVFWTEFVSADGLCSPGREVLKRDLAFTEREHPIVAQIFGAHPEHMQKTAELIRELGFDGIDINMGCPDKSIEKQGAGSAHMKNPKLAQEVIRAVMAGAVNIPVSVKTRVGYNKENLDEWLGMILETKSAVITVHARTRRELSLVPANWDYVKRSVELARGTGTLIMGNGDVMSLADGEAKAKATGADGVMIGRAIFGTPWFFDRARTVPPTLAEKFEILIEHTHLYEKLLGDIKNFAIMKKHYKAYAHGFDGAKELRVHLMEAKNADEVEHIARAFLKSL